MDYQDESDKDKDDDDNNNNENNVVLDIEAENDLLLKQQLCGRDNKDKNYDKEKVDKETVVGATGANDDGDSNNNNNEV